MKKKIIALITLVFFLIAAMPLTAFADTSGGFEYTATGSEAIITGYTGSETALVIPSKLNNLTVKSIGNDAFKGTSFVTVTLPDTLKSIGNDAFSACANLTSVTIPASVTEICSGVLLSCPKLTIYGLSGSTAQAYAVAAHIPFVSLYHTVTFNSQGGTSVTKISVENGKTFALPTAPTRTGYTFGGWYMEKACTTAWKSTDAVTKDITLYAKWVYGEPGNAYKACASTTSISVGKSVTFTVTTPNNITSVSIFVDGVLQKKLSCIETSGASKRWQLTLVYNKAGDRKTTFKAYKSTKLIKTFPTSAIIVTVTMASPTTLNPIVLDCDRAVLLGKLSTSSNSKITAKGFYYGTSASKMTNVVSSNKIVRGDTNKLITGLKPQTKYYYCAYAKTSSGIVKGSVLSFTTPAKKKWTAAGTIFKNTADRYMYLYGQTTRFCTTTNPPFGYVGAAEASKHIVKISVPVWTLKNGKKVASHMSLSVNYKLAEVVQQIFKEIYALNIKFPFARLSAYSYRAVSGSGLPHTTVLSHHSYGAAIDINSNANDLYIGKDKRNKKSPYYIPKSVIDIFAKYGWVWGGNFKECKDTMHFQYLGLDLMGK